MTPDQLARQTDLFRLRSEVDGLGEELKWAIKKERALTKEMLNKGELCKLCEGHGGSLLYPCPTCHNSGGLLE
jgi:hypothetical protein